MGVYSNTQIREAIKAGHIVCVPFKDEHVSHASLDVTLGYYFYRTGQATKGFVYNPFDESDVKRYFGEVQQAIPHQDWCARNGTKLLEGIPPEHPVIPLRPGERILLVIILIRVLRFWALRKAIFLPRLMLRSMDEKVDCGGCVDVLVVVVAIAAVVKMFM